MTDHSGRLSGASLPLTDGRRSAPVPAGVTRRAGWCAARLDRASMSVG